MLRPKLLTAGGGNIEFVGSASQTGLSPAINISLAGIPFEEGDLGILFIAADTPDTSYDINDWVEIVPSNGSYNREHAVWVKRLSAGDTSVTSASFTSTGGTVAVVSVFRNATITPADCALDGRSVGSSPIAPDPPAASVSDVSANDVVLVLAMHDDPSASITDGPTGGNFTTIYAGRHTSNCTAGVFYKKGESGQPNPDVVVGSGWTGSSWAAHTIILRPRYTPSVAGIVGSASAVNESLNSLTVDFSSIPIEAGDLAYFFFGDLNTSTTGTPSGWSAVTNVFVAPYSFLYRKVLLGNETSVTVNLAATVPVGGYVVVLRGYGHVTAGGTSGTSSTPDPSSVGGVGTTDIILTHANIFVENQTLTPPSGFTMLENPSHTGGSGMSYGLAYATGLSGTVDPGTYGGSGSIDSWTTITVRAEKA